jgi:5-hydroxyisourate hydrolase-like protein (transthyretin family)
VGKATAVMTHTDNSRAGRATSTNLRRRPARGGFSLLELTIAIGIFMLAAGLVSVTVARSLVGTSVGRTERTVTATMNNLLSVVAGTPYQSLVVEDFTPPSPCLGTVQDPSAVGTAARSCVSASGVQYEVRYEIDVQISDGAGDASVGPETAERTDYVILRAYAEVAGRTFTASKRVNAPIPSFRAGEGLLRVRVQAEPGVLANLDSPLLLLGADRLTLASSEVSAAGVALFRVADPDQCGPTNPCVLGLSEGIQYVSTATLNVTDVEDLSDVFSLSPSSALGPASQIIVTADEIVSASAHLVRPAALRILVRAVSPAGLLVAPPNRTSNSVCLYATFLSPTGPREVPGCNKASDLIGQADHITFTSFAADPDNPSGLRLPMPTGTSISMRVDPQSSCGAPGQIGYHQVDGLDSNTWKPAAVCTSYTWGVPTRLAQTSVLTAPISAVTSAPVFGSAVTLQDAQVAERVAVFTGESAFPATGAAAPGSGAVITDASWTRPRVVPACASTASCTPPAQIPELSACPNSDCLRASAPPTVLFPLAGSRGVSVQSFTPSPTVATTHNVSFAIRQDARAVPDSMSVSITSLNLPGGGTVSFAGVPITSDALPYPLVTGVGEFDSTASGLTYTAPAGTSAIASIRILAVDSSGGVHAFTLGLSPFSSPVPWEIFGTSVRTDQASPGATLNVSVIATNGEPLAGETVQVTAPNVLTVAASITTGVNGTAALPLSWGSGTTGPAAGSYTVVFGASVGRGDRTSLSSSTDLPNGASSTVRIRQSAGTLTLIPTGAGQGEAGSASVTLVDVTGRPWTSPGTAVRLRSFVGIHNLAGIDAASASSQVYSKPGVCTLDTAGTCVVPLVIQRSALAGGYSLLASTTAGSSTVRSVATFTVTSRAMGARLESGSLTISQGGNSQVASMAVLDGSGVVMTGVTPSVSILGGSGITASLGTPALGAFPVNLSASSATSAAQRPVLVVSQSGRQLALLPIRIVAVPSSLSAPVSSSVSQGQQVRVTVQALDASGSPAAGVDLSAALLNPTTGLSVDSLAARTNSFGQATFSVSAARTMATGPAGTLSVSANGQPGVDPVQISLVVLPASGSLILDGYAVRAQTSSVVLMARTSSGAPVTDRAVSVLSVGGTGLSVLALSGTTDGLGRVTLQVSSGPNTVPGLYKVRITVGDVSGTVLLEVRNS